jgi:hypothetical protein
MLDKRHLFMLQQFPEIQIFFKRNEFSGDELERLYQLIDASYSDWRLNNRARSLIDLELLKFKLKSKEKQKSHIDNTISEEDDVKKTYVPDNSDSFRNDGGKKKKLTKGQFVSLKMHSIRNGNYRNAAKELELSIHFIIKLLRKKGLNHRVKQFDSVDINLVDAMNGFILHRLRTLYQIKYGFKKKVKGLNKHGKNTVRSISPGVYGQLQKMGMGKVIYIRSR